MVFENNTPLIGFVDLTPKKIKYVKDILVQNPFEKNLDNSIYKICDYELSSGEISPLYCLNFDEELISKISAVISHYFFKIILIDTFEFENQIKIERSRPDEFYSQLKSTNNLLSQIGVKSKNITNLNFNNLEIASLSENLSYDAVHFSEKGHKFLFDNLIKNIPWSF